MRERDEEINRRGEKTDHRHRLRDVDGGNQDALVEAAARGCHPVEDRKHQRDDVRGEHPVKRAERVVWKMAERDGNIVRDQMLGVTTIREEQSDNRGEREERERAVDQTARVYFKLEHFRVTRISQHNRGGVSLKCKSHFGRINFGTAALTTRNPGNSEIA